MRRVLVLFFLCLLCASLAMGTGAQCPSGSYETAWNHNNTPGPSLNALHLAIIPRGTFAGKALVWNYGARITTQPTPGKSLDRTTWAIIDPETRQVVLQDTLQHDPNTGDLGCSGHAWTRDGKLVVAGGTKYSFESTEVVGARHMYIFDPSRSHLVNPTTSGSSRMRSSSATAGTRAST